MIQLYICDARIWQADEPEDPAAPWYISHPSNDAILASCETRAEAVMVRDLLNDLSRQLRTHADAHHLTPVEVK